MTYRQFVAHYKRNVLPHIQATYEKGGRKDIPARRQAFNEEMDSLCRSGQITDKQARTWDGLPRSLAKK